MTQPPNRCQSCGTIRTVTPVDGGYRFECETCGRTGYALRPDDLFYDDFVKMEPNPKRWVDPGLPGDTP